MTRPNTRVADVVSASAAGKFAGWLLLFGAASTVATTLGRVDAPAERIANFVIGSVAAVIGLIALALPWNRWPRSVTLVLLPAVFGLLVAGDSVNPDPYTVGIFFVVVAMWTGLCHRRYTTLALSPVIAFLYWYPLQRGPHLPTLASSTVTIAVVAVIVGEVLGALTDRLGVARERLIESQERRFSALAQHSSDVTMIFDRDHVITYVSPSVHQVFGYAIDVFQDRPLSELTDTWLEGLGEDTIDGVLEHSGQVAAGEVAAGEVAEIRIRHADGHWIDAEVVIQDRLEDSDISGVVVHIRDIHHRKQLERDLHRQAYHDDLTGLANRALFRHRLEEAIRDGAPLAVIFIDLDGFKVINDSAGHDRGDQVLRLVSQRFLKVIDSAATLARFGGDEFAVLVPTSAESPVSVCEQLLNTLSDPFTVGSSRMTIGASVGVAEFTGVESADDLIRNADTAMYVAKSNGTRASVWFEPSMRARLLERLDTEAMLRDGVSAEEFVVHYQPEIDLLTGLACGTEALVRWRHPDLGLVMPAGFIDVAEDSGLIIAIGTWVMRTACRDAAAWQTRGGSGRGVAVNVSVRQFQAPDFVDAVRDALLAADLDPRLLTIEITESVLIADITAAAAKLTELSALGVSIALDDFGTGYSSLSYLQRLPFDILKIDKSFIDHVTTEAHDLALVRTINRLGHDLGLRTLVEGIETSEQAAVVTELGCDFAQGYYFGRPVPVAELEAGWSRPARAAV